MGTSDAKTQMGIVAGITLVVILVYGVGAVYTLVTAGITFREFSAAMGPLAGLLVGYWVRDKQALDIK